MADRVETDKKWKPIRRGHIYCSPRCGMGCTHNAYLNAHKDAKALCARIGAGWVPEVWENLGWHHEAISPCGRLTVSGEGKEWIAFLGEPGSGGGRWAEPGKSPEDAIRAVVRVAVEDLHKIGAMIFDANSLVALPSRRAALEQATALFIGDSK